MSDTLREKLENAWAKWVVLDENGVLMLAGRKGEILDSVINAIREEHALPEPPRRTRRKRKPSNPDDGLRIRPDGQVDGLRRDFAAYEKAIFDGTEPAPFTCVFKNAAGEVVSEQPIPLLASGKPKIDLFG